MGDYTVYSAPADDLSDWRCEGVIYRAEQASDYNERPYMYAPDVVKGNGIKVYTDMESNTIAELDISSCGSGKEASAEISLSDGVYPIYLVFSGEGSISVRDICFN